MWQKDQNFLTKLGIGFLLVYWILVTKPEVGLGKNPIKGEKLTSIENFLTKDQITGIQQSKPEPTSQPAQIKEKSRQDSEAKSLAKVAAFSISREENVNTILQIIDESAQKYGVEPELLYKIASCESGLKQDAVNGQYAGLFQFHPDTWSSTRLQMGEDPATNLRFDPRHSIETAAYKISHEGTSAWPECR